MQKVTEYQRPGYTIIGNHLTQHRALSGLAIGLAAHIQSLPDGAPVDIRTLARRFPEGRDRIAAALRELETHGYLERVRRRTEGGQLVTVTLSYNNPEATRARRARGEAEADKRRRATAPPPHRPAPAPTPSAAPEPACAPAAQATPAAPAASAAPSAPSVRAAPTAPPSPQPEPQPPPRARLPRPRTPAHGTPAGDLLAGLRRDDARLLLSARDIDRLAPGVGVWLARGASPDAVRHALVSDLPAALHHPAALLAHRLSERRPPPLPAVAARSAPAADLPDPLQTCDGCERAFRAPGPGRCRDCRRHG
ncbi:helix-turn-helix domain-containing protein [Streptomyces kronopolitis]|uniref:helix-turn-helix domain-containing protein n=1 Tax=Streptomyces kronopolitis TaxID=1612435 RepID=UPI00341A0824